MLAAAMVEKLNEQINLEFYSSNLYLQMSAWCEDKGFEGAAELLRKHAREINELTHTAFTTHDYSTFNFLQWYVAEQHEEEKLFKGIIDKIELVGEDGKALFWIDKDLAQLAKTGSSSIMDPSA